MRRPRSPLPVVAGLFVGLVVIVVLGGLGRDDVGPDPARAARQWNLDLVGAPEAWATSRGEGIVVAVVDTGVDTSHVDLADQVVAAIDCVGAAGDPTRCRPGGDADLDGHGTHVAGLVAAAADNGHGIAGVAPEARLLAVRAVAPGSCSRRPCGGTGRGADVAAGVRWAVTAGADVVNLSLGAGTGGTDDDLLAALDEAWAAGVVVVVAGPTGRILTDIGDAPAVLVTAVDADGRPAPYVASVGEARWALAAPGGTARSDRPDGCHDDDAVLSTVTVPAGETEAYACLVGTSMAAPHVAGAVALLLADGWDPEAAVERLLATADGRDRPGRDPTLGAGVLDVAAAVTGS